MQSTLRRVRISVKQASTRVICRKTTSGAKVHPVASSGFTTEGAELYNKARPGYPVAAVQYIKEILLTGTQSRSSLDGPLKVLELGAGTGKFTRDFFNDKTHNNNVNRFHYTATEPSEGFRMLLEESSPEGVNAVLDGT